MMCRLLGVSRSGYYAWSGRAPSRRALDDVAIGERIRHHHEASGGIYGSPRIWLDLREEGILVGQKRVERLMRELGLEGAHMRRPKPTTTTPAPGVEVCDDLLERDFSPQAPNQTWVADIK